MSPLKYNFSDWNVQETLILALRQGLTTVSKTKRQLLPQNVDPTFHETYYLTMTAGRKESKATKPRRKPRMFLFDK